MKLEKIAYVLFAAFLVIFAASQAKSDIVVFKSGNYRECTIVGADDKYVTIKTDFGEQKFPRTEIMDFYAAEAGKPGSEYFRAGELYAKFNVRNKAIELFDKAIQVNPSYREQAEKILATTGATGTQPTTTTSRIPVTKEILTCPVCNGEGKRHQTFTTSAGTSIDRVVPCYFCDGKGLKTFELPNGTRKCPNCGGWGYTPGTAGGTTGGSGSSGNTGGATIKMGSKAGNIEMKQPCFQCNGKGYIGMPKAIETALTNPEVLAVAIGTSGGSVGYCSVTGTTTNPATGMTGTGSMGGTGSMPANPSGNTVTPTTTGGEPSATVATDSSSEEDKKKESESQPEEEQGFFSKYSKILLIGGGVVLLGVVLLLSKNSKK